MRKINGCLIVLSLFIVACMSEVKPILKPTQIDIPTRIANEQSWVDQAVASKKITREEAKPVQVKLYQIKETYNRLQSAGRLTAKDSDKINQMLDQCSDLLFRAKLKREKAY
ncbi:MAG: hypothetical protein ABSE08_11820 [Syntrophobacteraceae bacterium]